LALGALDKAGDYLVGDRLPQIVAVIGFVSDNEPTLEAVEKRRRGHDIVDLAGG
jgi:hypothetical protein